MRAMHTNAIGDGVITSYRQPPLVLRFGNSGPPLPERAVRALPSVGVSLQPTEAPPWLDSGPAGQPFPFCDHVQRLCGDIAARCESLAHIDVSPLLFAF